MESPAGKQGEVPSRMVRVDDEHDKTCYCRRYLLFSRTKWSLTLDVLDEADLENAMPFGAVDAATGEGLRTTASKVKGLIGKVSGIVSENEYEGDQEEVSANCADFH
ncbi:hypothetical protein Pmar_PMAR026043 [Perkinsus marinus ATCC 50983]|uniref:Uncharacterized protein n=1 Tax=Perkinsus marinus (strain ATCC 50983 / TXsc) TaxID=423536 RepID=C5LK97_PERM5|nr:hypothetical protein Pmar_PMAR026043 [Perkinsus marinus ATCC 50983]EER02884.1 hypothetical protein Pmar_PMAR026043 [Perkinsus marinus ATCC 50983]|eukprot:XP_002771068.1 hypothetical protein Pmar_PMAR026043 [Perkinsus marinus ATCC 50983]